MYPPPSPFSSINRRQGMAHRWPHIWLTTHLFISCLPVILCLWFYFTGYRRGLFNSPFPSIPLVICLPWFPKSATEGGKEHYSPKKLGPRGRAVALWCDLASTLCKQQPGLGQPRVYCRSLVGVWYPFPHEPGLQMSAMLDKRSDPWHLRSCLVENLAF